jgi:hypothetical protein
MKTKTTTRLCRRCKVDKPLERYYTDSRVKKDGRRAVCIDCLTNGRPPGPVPMDPLTRYKVDERGCWIWTGAVHKTGYGQVKWNGESTVAHRVVYQLLVGPIEDGKVLDHLCSVKLCVNPEHLDPTTHSVNIQRAWDRNHCATCTCKSEDTKG